MNGNAAWFNGNADAHRLYSDLSFVSHVWDDLVDGDPRPPADVNLAFELALFGIPNNPFYIRYASTLSPLIWSACMAYRTANTMEKSGDGHQIEIAHGLRYTIAHAGATIVALCNSRADADALMPEVWKAMMPERFSEYAKEHGYAA